jgi:hypothetical protein
MPDLRCGLDHREPRSRRWVMLLFRRAGICCARRAAATASCAIHRLPPILEAGSQRDRIPYGAAISLNTGSPVRARPDQAASACGSWHSRARRDMLPWARVGRGCSRMPVRNSPTVATAPAPGIPLAIKRARATGQSSLRESSRHSSGPGEASASCAALTPRVKTQIPNRDFVIMLHSRFW